MRNVTAIICMACTAVLSAAGTYLAVRQRYSELVTEKSRQSLKEREVNEPETEKKDENREELPPVNDKIGETKTEKELSARSGHKTNYSGGNEERLGYYPVSAPADSVTRGDISADETAEPEPDPDADDDGEDDSAVLIHSDGGNREKKAADVAPDFEIIPKGEIGEIPGWPSVEYEYYADNVLVDDFDDVITDRTDIQEEIGYEALKRLDRGEKVLYLRSNRLGMYITILKDDQRAGEIPKYRVQMEIGDKEP